MYRCLWLLITMITGVFLTACGTPDAPRDQAAAVRHTTASAVAANSASAPSVAVPATTDTAALRCVAPPQQDQAPGMTTVFVHFSCATASPPAPVYPFAREVSQTTDHVALLRAVISLQVAGPTATEQTIVVGPNEEHQDRPFFSPFSNRTAGMLLNIVTSAPGEMTINFADMSSVMPNSSTSAGAGILLSQLNSTVFQFPAVDRVVYQFNGSCAAFYTWLQMDCHPMSRTAWEAARPNHQQPLPHTYASAAVDATATPTILPHNSSESHTAVDHVAWKGLRIPIPAQHMWQAGAYGDGQLYGAPILAQGRLTYNSPHAPDLPEQPDGIGFTIVEFASTPDQWVTNEQHRRTGPQAIDAASIRPTTIAHQPAIAYSTVVPGLGQSETYVVSLEQNRLLLIETSDAAHSAYQTVVAALSFAAEQPDASGTLTPHAAVASPTPATSYTQAQFEADVGAAGAAFRGPVMMVDHGFTIHGERWLINNNPVFVYAYGDELATQRDAATVAPDGYMITRRDMHGHIVMHQVNDWAAPPRFYLRGSVIVISSGVDESTAQLLTNLLGPPFAGQEN